MARQLKLISWNLNGGPGSTDDRLFRAWHCLAALEPDIALVQEARRIPDWVSEHWQVFGGSAGVGTKKTRWGSGVLVRNGIEAKRWPLYERDAWLEDLEGYVVTARVEVSGGSGMLVASVHAPPDRVRAGVGPLAEKDLDALRLEPIGEWGGKRPDVWYSDYAFEALRRNAGRDQRFLIGGDWNTGRLFDNDPQFDPPIGTAFFVRARRKGWIDCHAWLGRQEERSYFGKRGWRHYQLDHLFADKKTAESLQECIVLAEGPLLEVSDHAPLVAKFEFNEGSCDDEDRE